MMASSQEKRRDAWTNPTLAQAAFHFYVNQRVAEFTIGWDERNGSWASEETRAEARCQIAEFATSQYNALMAGSPSPSVAEEV